MYTDRQEQIQNDKQKNERLMDFLIAVKECLPSLDMQGIRFHFMNDFLYQKIILYGDSDI